MGNCEINITNSYLTLCNKETLECTPSVKFIQMLKYFCVQCYSKLKDNLWVELQLEYDIN
jgi:hypothetical protein